ncbi:hypothetical protein H310_01838 [Aphanomyces invadans]|uniref:Uncharacterized protein n=1 Tax=Aphanomyces invadans TaxID=157072 RepID=A0A024ULU8_9STRA|nr:hypothetical protein H310_01838 [Aphanomyces invadans]ETW07279.1 hypothetical protein H310_01838 [Aphanomyces invadans]|eukprot:XP_008863372.1 hypothetical protein H310_01838 [Aphanomyces invadans]
MRSHLAALVVAAVVLGAEGDAICDVTSCTLLPSNDICFRRNDCGPCIARLPSGILNYTCYSLNADGMCDSGTFCHQTSTTLLPVTTRPVIPTTTAAPTPTLITTTPSITTTLSPPVTPPTPTPSTTPSSSTTAYITVGAVVGVACMVVGCFLLVKLRRKRQQKDDNENGSDNSENVTNEYVAWKEHDQRDRPATLMIVQAPSSDKRKQSPTSNASPLENEEADLWGNIEYRNDKTVATPHSFSHPNFLTQS